MISINWWLIHERDRQWLGGYGSRVAEQPEIVLSHGLCSFRG
ncbi:hypothetical protein SynBIOSU31_02538 [Synechococcus sp. BIOS-U3-1]|nr:hypothetical protein SynBIOSU31_02538 [Synechococcus sp. BIOS-U3-1]